MLLSLGREALARRRRARGGGGFVTTDKGLTPPGYQTVD